MQYVGRALRAFYSIVALALAAVGVEAWITNPATLDLWWPLYGVGFPVAGVVVANGVWHPRVEGMALLLAPIPLLLVLHSISDRNAMTVFAAVLTIALVSIVWVLEGLVLYWWDTDDELEGIGS